MAVRKASFFCKEADVLVASRSHSKAMTGLPVQVMTLDVDKAPDGVLRDMIKQAFIVVAALPGKARNDRIETLCREAGVLVNNAGGTSGDLIVPAVSSGTRYMIAITTDGSSPAVARYIREQLDERFPALDGMIALQEILRRDLKKREPSQARRSAVLIEITRDPEIWEALARSSDEAEAIARRKHF